MFSKKWDMQLKLPISVGEENARKIQRMGVMVRPSIPLRLCITERSTFVGWQPLKDIDVGIAVYSTGCTGEINRDVCKVCGMSHLMPLAS